MSFSFKFSGLLRATPKLIKYLVILTLAFGFLSGFFNSVLGLKLGISFVSLFALSAKGLFSGFIWQPLTFLFLPQIEGTLSLYFLFSLALDAYLLWFLGSKVYHLFGNKKTLKIFFIPPVLAALIATTLSYFFHFGIPLFGLTFAMISLALALSFSPPKSNTYFMPMQTKWISLGLIILYLFQDLSSLHWASLLTHALVAVISYFYLTVFHKLKSPFAFTSKLDNLLSSTKRRDTSSKIVYLYEEQARKESKMDKTFNKMKKNQKLNIWDKIKLRSYRNKG